MITFDKNNDYIKFIFLFNFSIQFTNVQFEMLIWKLNYEQIIEIIEKQR